MNSEADAFWSFAPIPRHPTTVGLALVFFCLPTPCRWKAVGNGNSTALKNLLTTYNSFKVFQFQFRILIIYDFIVDLIHKHSHKTRYSTSKVQFMLMVSWGFVLNFQASTTGEKKHIDLPHKLASVVPARNGIDNLISAMVTFNICDSCDIDPSLHSKPIYSNQISKIWLIFIK